VYLAAELQIFGEDKVWRASLKLNLGSLKELRFRNASLEMYLKARIMQCAAHS
jgi:hypothetical protein